MKTPLITAQKLMKGERFIFANDSVEAELFFEEGKPLRSWTQGFKIWFNGALIHSSKTLNPALNKLEKLIQEHKLIQSEANSHE